MFKQSKQWSKGDMVEKFDQVLGATRAVVEFAERRTMGNYVSLRTQGGYQAFSSQKFFEGRGWEPVTLLGELGDV